MFRLGSPSALGIVALVLVSAVAANPPEDSFQKTLAVQTAMVRARMFLNDSDSQKAVLILEENLRSVNGNSEYLVLLRDCYRAYIKDLYFAGQPELAERYLNRLVIIDAKAASDPALRPQANNTSPRKFDPEPEPVKQAITMPPFPKFKLPTLPNPFAKKEEPKDVPPTSVRARADEVSVEDPFDRKFQREMPSNVGKAQEYLFLGITEFANKRYTEARANFAQACQLDQTSLNLCREQYAYCMIRGVSDKLDQAAPGNVTDLQRQVEEAMKLSPKLVKAGKDVLQQIDQRAKQPTAVAKMNHLGANREGWQVTETANFRIFHKQDNTFAEQIGQIAEHTRLTMYRKWFGHDGVEWQLPCELIMHANADSYTQMTGVPISSPGHTRIESDPSGRVISRRMDLRCDIRGMVDAVLPHEATHVVLAGMFGSGHVPRWADEGIAVLSEPNEKIDLHRRNLLKNPSQLFGLRELMEMKDYPQPRQVSAFYAQSVVLTEFLANQKGPKVLADFIKDAQRSGYETSLQRHYGWSFAQLDQQWNQQVLSNPNRFAAQK